MRGIKSELKWAVPFALLALIALIEVRPEPKAAPLSGERTVVDVRGKQVHIALPFRGSVITRGTEVTGYVADTLEPDTLVAATAYRMGDRVRNHIFGRIFPQVVSNRRIWATEGISDTKGPKVEVERLLLNDPGVYMGWYTLAEPVERIGLPFIGFKSFPTDRDDLNFDTRAYTGAVGEPERGSAIIAKEEEEFRQLDEEMHADARMSRPSYIYLFSFTDKPGVTWLGARNHYTRFFAPHAGVVNACICQNYYASIDVEHLIAADPDIIVLAPQPHQEVPDDFVKDPRFRSLKAVINHRVYRAPPGLDYFIAAPFWSRWLAELAHPDRLEPKSREMYRDYIQWLLGYRLSDAELDIAFNVGDNHAMVDAKRFEAKPTSKGVN